MDARTFEPDEPLPRICKHCRWWDQYLWGDNPRGYCSVRLKNVPSTSLTLEGVPGPKFRDVMSTYTCDQWEEKA
jgi:hypothetical protein